MSDFQTEIFRRVYDNKEGHYLTVRPSPDFPDGNVLIHTEETEKDWFGDIRLDLPAKFMRELGKALIDAANEVEAP